MDKKEAVLTEYTIIPETRPIWKKRRYHNVALAFWAFIMVHSLRTNLSVAIVSMAEEVRVQYMLMQKTCDNNLATSTSTLSITFNFLVSMGYETTRCCSVEFLLWIYIYSIIRGFYGAKNWWSFSMRHSYCSMVNKSLIFDFFFD